jgi:RNA polymerase sigma-70 factor (ECF subfamily)
MARPIIVNDRDTDPSTLAPVMTASAATIAVVVGVTRPDEAGVFVLATYDAHHRELANFVRAIERDRDSADDIVSESFVRLLEEVRRGRRPDQPRAWLHRVAANLAIDRGRRRNVVGRVLGRLVDHRTEPPPDDEVLRGETRREVRDALSHLSTDARTALLLAAHGFSGRDIAEALGRSELATRSLICRARLRLREQLDGSEVPS